MEFDIKIYSMNEVAKILKVSKRTIYDYIKSGELKVKKIGGKWIITEENLKKFIETE